jgi:NADH-quinone oxidoreductase subunit N
MYFGEEIEKLDVSGSRRLTAVLAISALLMISGTFFSLFGIESLASIAAGSLAN